MDPNEILAASLTQADGRQGPVHVLAVNGEIRHDTVDALERMAIVAYENGARRLLLDLSGSAEPLNSAGLRAIVILYRIFDPDQDETPSRPSAHFQLVAAAPQTLRTLRVAGFEPFIPIYPDRAAALENF